MYEPFRRILAGPIGVPYGVYTGAFPVPEFYIDRAPRLAEASGNLRGQ